MSLFSRPRSGLLEPNQMGIRVEPTERKIAFETTTYTGAIPKEIMEGIDLVSQRDPDEPDRL